MVLSTICLVSAKIKSISLSSSVSAKFVKIQYTSILSLLNYVELFKIL